jgi:hypothetical protein
MELSVKRAAWLKSLGNQTMAGGSSPKQLRLAEFYRRLGAATPAANRDEAYRLLCVTLEAVEDELTDTPNILANHDNDGRLYPPQMDNCTESSERPGWLRCRSRQHSTFFGPDGSIEIVAVTDRRVVFSKVGATN